jgi:hypothetical protein
MRLPAEDPELSAQVVDSAIAAGVNYFETTRGYIDGRCQHLVGPGLKGRSRGLIVSGKAGVNAETTASSYREEIERQMGILGVDYLEFFQVGWFSWKQMPYLTKRGGALEALDKARAEGIVGHIGFTGHDSPESFTKCIETGLFDSLTIPYNMLSREYAPTIKRAGELGIGVIAMCPVAGGMLAEPSAQLQQLIPGGATTTAAAALQFVLANPDVSCAASGMNTLEMVAENVAVVESLQAMNDADRARMEQILDEFAAVGAKFCTACGYCMPCPNGIDIPRNFRFYNQARVYGLMDWAKERYASTDAEKRASACVECGQCEPKCPNQLPIVEQLAEVAKALG